MIGISFVEKSLDYLNKNMKSQTWSFRVIQGQGQLGPCEDLLGPTDGALNMVGKPFWVEERIIFKRNWGVAKRGIIETSW